jgi:hypothetical protein
MSEQEKTEKTKPLVSLKVPPFSVALWEFANKQGPGKHRTVSVEKSIYHREQDTRENRTIWLQLSEVSCLATLLRQMEETVVNGNPF